MVVGEPAAVALVLGADNETDHFTLAWQLQFHRRKLLLNISWCPCCSCYYR